MKIITKPEIERAINIDSIIKKLEKGFVLYSNGQVTTTPVSSLTFVDPPADVHIKSGYIADDDFYVIKIASGFYDNPSIGLSSSDGLMLLFSRKTGQLEAALLDNSMLTDLRTGLAGAIAAKYLANHPIQKIGIIGTGIQAREQLKNLQFVSNCKSVLVWGRNEKKAVQFANDALLDPFDINVSNSIDELAENCDLIITTTPSKKPLLFGHQLKPGTHVTAVGADSIGKHELDLSVFHIANLVTVDSFSQCSQYGDFQHAKHLDLDSVVELGKVIENPITRAAESITISDLTGIAVQDLQIAKAIYSNMQK